ncbi:MAG: pyruvate kinase, partial [Angelakisella sp.]
IYDGTSAIMLSGETAAGSYPVEAVKTMATIAERVENDIDYRKRFRNREDEASPSITDAISHATCTTAHDLHAAAIIPVSKSGRTARMISKYRPAVPIIACTSNECTYRQLSLSWGVTPMMMDEVENTDDLLEQAIQAALENSHLLHDGDLVVLTAGIPVGMSGTTNLLKVQTVGCPLVSGTGLNTLSTVGNVCVAHNNEELFANFNFGDILVCNDTCDLWMKLVAHAAGVIVEQGANSHIATVADQLGIPVIFAAEGCCHVLQSGMTVVMDAKSGVVSPIAAEQTSVKFPERK